MSPASLAVGIAAALLLVAAAGANPSRAEDAAASDRVRQLLMRPLTPESVVQVSLLNNQGLQATLAGIGVFPADLIEAGLLSNSSFAVERHSAADDVRADAVREFVEVATTAFSKRSLGRALEGTRRHVTQAVVDLIADARSTFYALLAAEQSARLCQDAVKSTGVAADLTQQLRSAGNIDQLHLQTEQGLAAQAQLDRIAAEDVATQTRERLNAIMGLWGPATMWSVAARFPDLPATEVPLTTVESLAMEQRLDLAAARQEIVAIVQGRGLSDVLQWVPTDSLDLHESRKSQDAESSTGSNASLMLPVLDWRRDPMPPEHATFLQKQQRYKALAVEVHSKVRVAYTRLMAARTRVQLYQQTIVPLQSDTLRQAELQHNAMALGPLELFRIRQQEIDTHNQYIAAQRDYWVARTDLEHELGCCAGIADVSRGAALARAQTPAQSATQPSAH